jgi:queuosine precursor transporter
LTASRTSTWTIALTSAFVLALVVADLAATKFVLVAGVVAPGGVFLFSIIFVVRDALHRNAGAEYVRRLIWIAAGLNVAMAAYFWFIARMAAPPFFDLAEPWAQIFTLAPAIVLGSITAAVASQYVNTWAYEKLWRRNAPVWVRSIGSNLVSLPVDSVLFVGLAFLVLPSLFGAEPIPWDAAVGRIVSGQILIKLATVVVLTPLVYATPENPDVAPDRADELVALGDAES